MVLLKHKYDATISWINEGGYNLFKKFIACTSSHSVMHILTRLLLPRNITLAGIIMNDKENCCAFHGGHRTF